MLKVELHAHTSDDPDDVISHTTSDLIEHASSLGYGALAVTLHDRYFDPAPWSPLAQSRGITLLSGIERTIDGTHVLLVNFPAEVAAVRSFHDVDRLKAATHGLVIAPHPFFPVGSAFGTRLNEHARLIDAIEVNAIYTRSINFNRRAIEWAQTHGKPLVGNTDLHLLGQLGTTYSLVDALPDASAICDAIRSGRVTVSTTPLSTARAASVFGQMVVRGIGGRLRRLGS